MIFYFFGVFLFTFSQFLVYYTNKTTKGSARIYIMKKTKPHKNINTAFTSPHTSNMSESNFAGDYICQQCNQKIIFTNKGNNHLKECPLSYKNQYNNNKSSMIFTFNKPSEDKVQNKLYSNYNFSLNSSLATINDFFDLSDKIFHKIKEKINLSNFLIQNLESDKTITFKNFFIEIEPNLKDFINLNKERIYYGKVVIFEDIFHKTPVFRLSFQNLKNEPFNLKFKVHSNTQHPELKKLYKQLILIPSKNKRRVSCNSGSYTLGKSIFIQGILKENPTNLYFTDIKNIWLCDADNKYDKLFNI